MTSIGQWAFSGCSGLTEVTIGESVKTIYDNAFNDCNQLKAIQFNAKNCDDFPKYSPFENSAIKEIHFGNNVELIPAYIVKDCSGLTTITIPNNVTTIGECAFSGCSNLTEITIPGSVSVLKNSAFAGCNGLKINVCDGITTIGDDFTFNGCSGVTEIITPNSVINIKDGACNGCSDLKSITIGSKVENIESGAFDECKNIEEVNSLNTTPPAITERTFAYETYDKATLYVPTGCRNIYWLHPYWEDFFEIKEKDFPTGITNPTIEDNEQAFEIVDGKIHFTKDGENIYIYNIDGTIVYKGVSQCGKTVEVPAKGIYIVKSGSYSTKVAL